MRKSKFNIPNKNFKIEGNVGYKNLSDKWEKWFKDSWKKHLKNIGLRKANPNMIAFPQKMGRLGYYASFNKNKFQNLNKNGNTPAHRGLAKQRLEKYKQLVRNRMGVKRVTVQAQVSLWNKLSNKNKKQFGSWKPEGVVKHRTNPPKPKKPTIMEYLRTEMKLKTFSRDSLLRYWVNQYTQEEKKAIYKKIRDYGYAKKYFPLCKC